MALLIGVSAAAQTSNEAGAVADPTRNERSRSSSYDGKRSDSNDGKRSDGSRRYSSFSRRSTAEYLRELLPMSPEQLDQALAEKSENSRKFWLAKVEEYKALSPYDREVRLRTTQMQYYLEPLLWLKKPELRQERLAAIPEDFRPLVEERLRHWDQLPLESRREVLENKWTMTYFSRIEAAPPDQRDAVFSGHSTEYRLRMEQKLDEWRALPKEQRGRMYENFNQFFQLSEKEKDRILGTLSLADRKLMDAALEQFEKLPPDERKKCIDSFRKYVNMTPEQRAQFLKNAERWNQMSDKEKEKWRTVVPQLPPVPPGLAPAPPLPPGFPAKPAPTP
ncbi:MAG: DUF3106 domain-containing protein [Verrucomicrobiota bacterium]